MRPHGERWSFDAGTRELRFPTRTAAEEAVSALANANAATFRIVPVTQEPNP